MATEEHACANTPFTLYFISPFSFHYILGFPCQGWWPPHHGSQGSPELEFLHSTCPWCIYSSPSIHGKLFRVSFPVGHSLTKFKWKCSVRMVESTFIWEFGGWAVYVKSNTYSTPLSASIIYLLAPPKLQNTHKARWELMVASFLNDVALLDYSTMEKTHSICSHPFICSCGNEFKWKILGRQIKRPNSTS